MCQVDKSKKIDALFELIASITDPADCKALFQDLCTAKEIENMAQGTTGQTSLSNKELGKLEIFIPPLKIQNEVSQILKANIDTITYNLIENEKLKQLRDILLPKLMNGEIDLDKIEN